MDSTYAVMLIVARTIWAAFGVILGIYAIIRVRKQRGLTWWFQVVATPLSALFVVWITIFRVALPWQIILPLIPMTLLAFPNSLRLLEANNKTGKCTLVIQQ